LHYDLYFFTPLADRGGPSLVGCRYLLTSMTFLKFMYV